MYTSLRCELKERGLGVAEWPEALGASLSYSVNEDDISHYVSVVTDFPGRKPGLVEVDTVAEDDEDPEASEDARGPVPDGKRVICSVGGVEAVSAGYIENLPADLLIDSGAVARLVDSRVLARLGLSKASLRPYHGGLNGVSGNKLRIIGEIDLPLRLGSLENLRGFVAFRAVIDLDENIMTLKESGETFPPGSPRVEEVYVSRIASSVRLCPGGQALVVSDLAGEAPEGANVLIEGVPGLDSKAKVARTLCSVNGGKTL
ncbi:hypothetical protein PHYSODRAFT_520508, partial [Phytophthora sojae]